MVQGKWQERLEVSWVQRSYEAWTAKEVYRHGDGCSSARGLYASQLQP
jgi:hypothetical protein